MNGNEQDPGGAERTTLAASPRRNSFSVWDELLEGVAQGKPDSFEALYEHSNALLFGLIMRIVKSRADAEEIAHDVYTQVWNQAKRFDRKRGTALSWLVLLARSRALDFVRSSHYRHRPNVVSGTAAPDPPDLQNSPEEAEWLRQQREAVRRAVASLPEEQRCLLEMAFFDGLTHSELAAQTKAPLGTVKTRLRSAFAKLRSTLSEIR